MMIKLKDIEYEDRKGMISYVLPGCIHTSKAIVAMSALNKIDALISSITERAASLKTQQVTKTGAIVTRRNSDDWGYFL